MDGNSLEIRRKLFHLFLGMVLVLMIYSNILKFWICLVMLIGGLIISLASRRSGIPIINWFLESFDRPEHRNLPGKSVIALMFSLCIMIILRDSGTLSDAIVMASIMIWALGDSVNAIIGRRYGRIRHPLNNTRFIEGTVSGIVAGAFGAMIFVPVLHAILASFVAISIESFELHAMKHPIDDNFLVPLISALVLVILFNMI